MFASTYTTISGATPLHGRGRSTAAHPGVDLLNTLNETLNSGRCRRGRSTDVGRYLSVVSVHEWPTRPRPAMTSNISAVYSIEPATADDGALCRDVAVKENFIYTGVVLKLSKVTTKCGGNFFGRFAG